MASELGAMVNGNVLVLTQDGRIFVGKLRGVDQTYNLILEDTYERVFSASAGVETVKLGLYIIRGDNVATVGELDAATDASLNWADFTAEPLGPIVH